jgi:hypothetical protein
MLVSQALLTINLPFLTFFLRAGVPMPGICDIFSKTLIGSSELMKNLALRT